MLQASKPKKEDKKIKNKKRKKEDVEADDEPVVCGYLPVLAIISPIYNTHPHTHTLSLSSSLKLAK